MYKYEAGIHTRSSYVDNFWLREGCFNLCRMMRIIINDRYIANFAFILESAVCTAEIFQTIKDHFCRQVKKLSCSDRCQSIGYIVNARHFQRTCAQVFSVVKNMEGCMAKFVISNVCGCVFSIVFQTVGDHFTWKIFCDHFVFWCICINDESTFCREKFCKFAEGMTDIINIFEEIKMIRINIQNDPIVGKSSGSCWCIRMLLSGRFQTVQHGYYRRLQAGYRLH